MDDSNKTEVDKGVKRHFDEMSFQYYDAVDATPFLYGYYHRKELSWIRNSLRSFLSKTDPMSLSSFRVLDVGCATGRIIGRLGHDAPETFLVGMDLSSRMIKIAKSSGSQAQFVVGDIRNMPFRESAFDFVYALEVLEHLDRKFDAVPRAVNEVMRVTRLGGLTTLESTSLWHFRIQEAIQRGLPGIHVSLLQQKSFERYSKVYRSSPLTVAQPSSFAFVSDQIVARRGRIEGVTWIRVIPEQVFVVMNNNLVRGILSHVDEMLSRLPGVKQLGREFIISSIKTSD